MAVLADYQKFGGEQSGDAEEAGVAPGGSRTARDAAATLDAINDIYPVNDEDLHRRLGALWLEAGELSGRASASTPPWWRCIRSTRPARSTISRRRTSPRTSSTRPKQTVLGALEAAPGYPPGAAAPLEDRRRRTEARHDRDPELDRTITLWLRRLLTLTLDSAELKERIERFRTVRDEILAQVHQVIVGQDEVLEQILIALFVGGHCLITGLPGTAKTLMVRTIAQTLGLRVQAHSVHAGPDAVRHHRHRHHRGGSDDRPPPVDVRAGADLRQHPAGRRDQPHAAQDAVGAARGDAGALLHGARQSLRAAVAVLRPRDAESDRARRHLSAARGAARSLPLQHRARLPERQGRSEGGGPDDGEPRRADRAGDQRRGDSRVPAAGPHGADRANRSRSTS